MPIVGLHVVVRLLQNLFEDWQLNVAQALGVHTDHTPGVFAQAGQEVGVLPLPFMK